MKMQYEKLYFSPAEFPSADDTAAIQAAVDEAERRDIRVVSIQPKADGSPWRLERPVRLPSYITVIVDGATVESPGILFMNANADVPASKNLGGEQHKIFLLGRHGGKLLGTGNAPQILLSNARDCRIADLTFEGGAGIALDYFRYSKVQQLKFTGSTHAVVYSEGCNNIIMESICAETDGHAILTCGGNGFVMGRDNGIYNSIFCRIHAKTGGTPAVALFAGESPLYNIVLRDVTDDTAGYGASVVIGSVDDNEKIRDLTVRGVRSRRNCVHTCALCDGMFYSNLHCPADHEQLTTAYENTRALFDGETMEIVLPQFPAEKPDRPFLTPNAPEFYGRTDGETIQNTVHAASIRGINLVVIPRWNVRAQQARWDIERAIKIPSYMTVVFLHAHLRQADFCYENMFTNTRAYEHQDRCLAHEEHDLTFTGIGDAVLDGGKPNGLLEKTCNMYGLPDKRPNATVLFNNVRNLVLENFQIRQSRWYGTYFIHCDTCRVSNIDFDDWEDCCNRDGVDMRSGCHNFLVENITGTTGDDTVALNNLGNDGNDGRYVAGKDPDTLNMVIRNIKSDAGRWFTVRLLCQDRHLEQNFTLDTIMDVSCSENQKGVGAAVMVGSHEYHYKIPAELGDLAHLTIRDVYSRSPRCVSFGGCSDDVQVSNLHVYSDGFHAVSVTKQAHLRDVQINGVFYKRDQLRLRQAGTADADLNPSEAYEGTVIELPNLKTDNLTIQNVYADTAAMGVRLTGSGHVDIRNFNVRALSGAKALCGSDCTLIMDGEVVSQTTSIPL